MLKQIDFKLIKLIVFFYTIVALIYGFKTSYWKINGYVTNLTWTDIWVYNGLFDWFVVIIFMIMISLLTKKMFDKKIDFKYALSIHLFFSIIIGFVIFICTSFMVFLFLGDINRVIRNTTLDHFMRLIDVNFLVYFSLLGIIYGYYYITKIKNIETQKTSLQAQLITTKMNVLKAKLRPHFVFNTLNSISSLIEIDKKKSQQLISDFRDLFSDVLDYKDENLIPLKQELSMLNKYIDIILVRFSDHLVINLDIDKSLEQVSVPIMLIQPLIENSITHGYSYHKTELLIDLKIIKEENYLKITIKNNGELLKNPFTEILHKGTGVKNTYDRLSTLYNNDFEFRVNNILDGSGVITFVKIPINLSSS